MGATYVGAIPGANVQWSDATGAAEIMVPNLRFGNWNPTNAPIGATRVALASGLTYVYVERWDYTVTFEMDALPPPTMKLMQRLKVWLETGGQITVNTQDANLATYQCILAPGSRVTWTWDRVSLWFTMSLSLKNVTAAPMTCYYSTQVAMLGYTLSVLPTSLTLSRGSSPTGTIVPTLTDPAGNTVTDVPTTFLSSNPNIASVASPSGVVTAHANGTCTITVSTGGLSTTVFCTVTS